MKDRVFYACEGFVVTFAGYHWTEQVLLPLMVACIGAALTVVIQHYLKRWLNTRDNQLPKFRQNGKHNDN